MTDPLPCQLIPNMSHDCTPSLPPFLPPPPLPFFLSPSLLSLPPFLPLSSLPLSLPPFLPLSLPPSLSSSLPPSLSSSLPPSLSSSLPSPLASSRNLFPPSLLCSPYRPSSFPVMRMSWTLTITGFRLVHGSPSKALSIQTPLTHH